MASRHKALADIIRDRDSWFDLARAAYRVKTTPEEFPEARPPASYRVRPFATEVYPMPTAKRRRAYSNGGRRKYQRTSRGMTRAMVVVPSSRGYLRTGGFYSRMKFGQELKFKDFTTSFSSSASGTIETITEHLDIAQGDGPQERIGRRVKLKSFYWKITMRLDSVIVMSGHNNVRVIAVLDKQCNGSAPALSGTVLTTATQQSNTNLENSMRFRILYDRVFTFNHLAGGAGGDAATNILRAASVEKYVEINLPVNGLVIDFDSSLVTGVISTRRSNNIMLYFFTSHASPMNHSTTVRIRYEG